MNGVQIVIADDDADLLRLLEGRLGRAGYTVLACSNGNEAYDLVRHRSPVILLADWIMPGLTGPELCRKIRASTPDSAVYIILLTVNGDQAQIVAGFEAGADDYLVKPASEAELLGRIRSGERLLSLLVQQEERASELETVIEANPTGIIIVDGASQRIVRINSRARQLAGVTDEEVIGRRRNELLCPLEKGVSQSAAEGRTIETMECVLLADDGRRIPVLRSAVPITIDGREHLLEAVTDITARKQAEDKLREGEKKYRILLENLPQRIFYKDKNSVYVSCNQNYASDLGITTEAIAGKTDDDFYPRGLAEKYRADDRRVMESGETGEIDEEYQRDGKKLVVRTVKTPVRDRDGNVVGILGIFWDVTERSRAEEQLRLQGAALEAAANAIVITDRRGRITWVNQAFTELTGYSEEEALGQTPRLLKSGKHNEEFYRNLWHTVLSGQVWHGEIINRRKDGSLYTDVMTITPVQNERGEITHFVAIKRDVTQEKILESQLVQAQKMESIGQLAAGIAHEINTPTQFVGDNTRFLQDAFVDLQGLLAKYAVLAECCRTGSVTPEIVADAEAAAKQADLDYLQEEIPRAIAQALEGVERVTKIVRAMKDFSHPGGEGMEAVDLNKAIESTITVARNEWKYVAEVVTDFDPALPLVPCFLGDFNQVILNIIINATHAIADVVGDGATGKGTITVSTRHDGRWAEIRVRDTGTGIRPEYRAKVFDHFFTTKEVGKGTGQGLAIAYSVVTEKHGGTITFETEMGEGTTFIIRLPVEREQATAEETSDREAAHSLR
jgi:PAS domain S-box-containing protein